MENLEELKREAQLLREKFNALKGFSDYLLISIIRLKDVYSKTLFLPLEDVFKSNTNINFFLSLFSKKKNFEIEEIRLDLINNMSNLEIAMKYQEPESVIQEIKDNIHLGNFIVKSKLYKRKELSRVFGFSESQILLREDFMKISETDNNTYILYWRGDLLSDNFNALEANSVKSSNISVIENKIKYLKATEVRKTLNLCNNEIYTRLKASRKIFGVTIEYITPVECSSVFSYKNIYCKEEDILLALKNKKYYIEVKKVLSDIRKNRHSYTTLGKAYKDKYNKSINLKNKYIKKETLNNFLNLAKELGYYNKIMGQ